MWESLAILEYAAEKFPDAGLWPSDPAARAHARAISTEMHAGFVPLRNECGMTCGVRTCASELSDDAKANIARIQALWTDARTRFGAAGRSCSAASARPTRCTRRSSRASRPTRSTSRAPVKAYMQAMIALPAWQEWRRAALSETWVIPQYEDFPQSQRLKA